MKLKELKSILVVERLNIVVKNPIYGWNILKYEYSDLTNEDTLFKEYGEHEVKEIFQNQEGVLEIMLDGGLVL